VADSTRKSETRLPGAAQDIAPGLWSRIKDHKLIQAAIAYLVAALAIAHGEELVAGAYHWPEHVGRIVIGILGLGLPLTLVVVSLAEIKASSASRIAVGRTLDRIFLLVLGLILVILVAERLVLNSGIAPTQLGRLMNLGLGLLVVALLADRLWMGRRSEQASPPIPQTAPSALRPKSLPADVSTQSEARSQTRSIAVLPFTNLSSDSEQEYFSDGLTEELISHLAHIKGLRVIARTSSFAFKGKNEDLRVVGEKLSVGSVLEGSVRKAGNRLRIAAQLIDCTAGHHLWSETFDRELDDVFAIQSDISRSVATALGVALGIADAVPPGGTRNLQAYELYLRAQSLLRLRGSSDLRRSAELFRQALALDPEFALAWKGLARSLSMATAYLPETSTQVLKEWDHSVERTRTLAPTMWASYAVSGGQDFYRHNWSAALRAFSKAVELSPPSEAEVLGGLSLVLASIGRVEDAIPHLQLARSRDPLSLDVSSYLQIALTSSERYQEAGAEYDRSQDLPGDRTIAEGMALHRAWAQGLSSAEVKEHWLHYIALDTIGMPVFSELVELMDQPQAVRNRLRKAFEDPSYQDPTRQFRIALCAARFDDTDLALMALRRSYVNMQSLGVYYIWLPTCRHVRKDPRFKDLLRDLKIVDYWRETGQYGDFARFLGTNDFEVW
jgi:TolB-like protein/tetratricopeptide (TPR) repeat protein